MTLKNRIKVLIEILEDSNIDKLEVSSFWGLRKIKLFQNKNSSQNKMPDTILKPIKETYNQLQNKENVVLGKEKMTEESISKEFPKETIKDRDCIKAPLVGTVYLSPNPGEPEFIKENDIVKKGQVVCVIEAMKIFNDIESDKDGIINKILVTNEDPVEFGQSLFEIISSNK